MYSTFYINIESYLFAIIFLSYPGIVQSTKKEMRGERGVYLIAITSKVSNFRRSNIINHFGVLLSFLKDSFNLE